jgi:hypothetical protein
VQDFRIADLFAGLLSVAIVGMTVNTTLRRVERRLALAAGVRRMTAATPTMSGDPIAGPQFGVTRVRLVNSRPRGVSRRVAGPRLPADYLVDAALLSRTSSSKSRRTTRSRSFSPACPPS